MYLFFLFICSIHAFKAYRSQTTYGNFKDAIYNSKRNEYFWKDRLNINHISKDDAFLICNGWRICDVKDISKSVYIQFNDDIKNDTVTLFSWNPNDNKNDVKALFSIYESLHDLHLLNILYNPYVDDEDKSYLKDDLDQIKFLKNKNLNF